MNEELVNRYIMKADNDLKTAKDELETDKPATDTVLPSVFMLSSALKNI
ncbi:MAG: hypothetical protein M0Z57_02415 [Deltaproteobacteria bacterium]|jgi:hypothetical protein|nr:hypothetical protein [Deltaproteobacteria bacterium]